MSPLSLSLSLPVLPFHLLTFSPSGHTKKESPSTEAQSYMRLAQATGLLPPEPEGYLRVTTEDDALDSFQNLLFSIARFHEYTGRYPARVTVIGYEMKRRRFEELHRAAIRWPEGRFAYVGVDAEGSDVAQAREGEVRRLWRARSWAVADANMVHTETKRVPAVP